MADQANTPANAAPEKASPTRRRGKPPGHPKPPGSGRKPGTPNRITRDVRAVAAQHSAKAIRTLVKLLGDNNPKVQAIAAREILDRAHGKPATPITGAEGAPLIPATSDMELAQVTTFLLAKASRNVDPAAHPNVTPIRRTIDGHVPRFPLGGSDAG